MALLACVQLEVYYVPSPLFFLFFCLCTATVDVYIQLSFNKRLCSFYSTKFQGVVQQC